jgi:hypothetical protein
MYYFRDKAGGRDRRVSAPGTITAKHSSGFDL